MKLKLKIPQKTKIGMLHPNIAYTFDDTNPAQVEVRDSLLARKVAYKTTDETEQGLAADKEAAAQAVARGEVKPEDVPADVAERAAVLAQEAEEAAKLGADDAKATAKKAAKGEAAA